ncbi:MAG: Do family serine endopeptidase [Phycisphaerae bacterium]|nr:DegQ family serine endoprotease [Phycisphaerae bacterium]NIP50684.1 DegQ family serine endoprotease [Phycisphaerae bacterium]NIS52369.1 DegQ family serine endoprotease [Phycisphaerae bacterium]NIU11930.1 DegQ family serine endoprotease [Phycisphaerae bacterium]NIU57575.1 Do family serine endopeptidase [Phycisphaerae bacterium]
MRTISLDQKKTCTHYRIISVLFVFLIVLAPLSALAEDAGIDALRQVSKAFAKIAEEASPAVVGIKAEKTITYDQPTMREWPFGEQFDPFEDDIFDRFFRWYSPRRREPRQRKYQQRAQGSGFIVSADGYILTNNHLVGDADKVLVKVEENSEVEAKVIGTDPDSDVAVIKIDAKDLTHLELADSDKLEVGEWVVAIGNPFRLSQTVTAGIVSAKGRSGFRLATFEDYIQTDAAINPGNSGGPLLNLDGKVVGINTFIISQSGGYMGIGFAIPINMVKFVYQRIIEKGEVERGYLGIWYEELTPESASTLGLDEDTKGVAIADVLKDSAAEKAGLKRYDVIIELDGKPVENGNEFLNRVSMLKPGTKVKIVVLRDGKRKTLSAKLERRPSQDKASDEEKETSLNLGFTVKNLTDEYAERLGFEELSGVLVTGVEAGSKAAEKGIAVGMLIMEVNREPVKNTKEFDEAIKKAGKDGSVLLLVNDGRYTRFIVLKLDDE